MATTKKSSSAKADLKKITEAKTRLAKNALTNEDKALLKALLGKAEQDAKGKSVAGRPIVARLPHGMDIIK